MEEKPYKFEDPENRRRASNITERPNTITPVAGAIFLASLYLY